MSPPWTRRPPSSTPSVSPTLPLSSPVSRWSLRSRDSRQTTCQNCLQTHAPIPGKYTTNCILIHVRTRLSPTDLILATQRFAKSAYTTLPVADTADERRAQMEFIWALFEDIIAESEASRRQARREDDWNRASTSGAGTHERARRGTIRERAPLVWLRWIACDGRRGQTRSKTNWEEIWERLVTGRDGLEAGWVTLSPLHASNED